MAPCADALVKRRPGEIEGKRHSPPRPGSPLGGKVPSRHTDLLAEVDAVAGLEPLGGRAKACQRLGPSRSVKGTETSRLPRRAGRTPLSSAGMTLV